MQACGPSPSGYCTKVSLVGWPAGGKKGRPWTSELGRSKEGGPGSLWTEAWGRRHCPFCFWCHGVWPLLLERHKHRLGVQMWWGHCPYSLKGELILLGEKSSAGNPHLERELNKCFRLFAQASLGSGYLFWFSGEVEKRSPGGMWDSHFGLMLNSHAWKSTFS